MTADDLRAATAALSALVAERAPGTTLEMVLATGSRPVLSRLRAHAGGRWTCIRRGGHVLSRGRALMDAIRPMRPHAAIGLGDIVAIADAEGGFACFRRAPHEGWTTGAGASLGVEGARAFLHAVAAHWPGGTDRFWNVPDLAPLSAHARLEALAALPPPVADALVRLAPTRQPARRVLPLHGGLLLAEQSSPGHRGALLRAVAAVPISA